MTSSHAICWNAYPALIAAACFAAGICAAEGLHGPPYVWMMVGGCALIVALGAVLIGSHRIVGFQELLLTAAAFAMLFASGAMRHVEFSTPGADHIVHSGLHREVEVTGWIVDAPSSSARSVRFMLRLDGAETPFVGLLLVSVRDPAVAVRTCDVVRLRGELADLPRRRNPGDFDYGAYLRRQRVYARLFASDIVLVGTRRSGITCLAADVRDGFETRIDRYLVDRRSKGVLRALLLGDRRAIDRSVRDQFARTGLLHVLAVSGLHVMVVGMILYQLLRPSLMRLGLGWRAVERTRMTLTALLLLCYMVLAGGSASVVRAVVMAQLLMLAAALQRGTDSMNTLGAAALIILAVRPAHLFEPGFQLSMTAVGAILGLTPQLQRWIPVPSKKIVRHVHTSTTVTIAATMGTLPVVVSHFGQAALGGLVLNLPAIPLTTGVLVSGIAAVAGGELTQSFGATLGASADVLARSLLAVAEWGDRYVGWSLVEWSIDHPAPVISMCLLVVAVGRWRSPHHRWTLILSAVAVLTVHVWMDVAERRWVPSLQVLFLDVGQGDAAVVLLPDGSAMLVDAGPRTRYTDAGADVILPQLELLGVRRLETVIITHPDSDHLGGLPSILRSVPVGRVVRSGFIHSSVLFEETNHLLDSLEIPHRSVRAGDTLNVGSSVRAYVFQPGLSRAGSSPNDHSIVLRLVYGSTSMLLTGDAPVAAELAMVRRFGTMLTSQVLKVGHHGSRTSSSPAFLSAVNGGRFPMAVVSVAERNRYGLPDEDVLARLSGNGYEIRSTAESGAVWVRSDGRRVESVAY